MEKKDKIDSQNKNFKYYLTQIAKNLCINYMKRKNNHPITYLDSDEIEKLSDKNNLENKESDDSKIEFYMNLIRENLDDNTYDILTLHYLTRMKFKDIAKLKNTTTSAVTAKASKAIKLLREKLKYDKEENN
jgi:RNA polymerase sigma factor (sigma-70 family)